MRTKQLIRSILSVALCLTVGCSTAITVFAGSGGNVSDIGGDYSAGSSNSVWAQNGGNDIIKITASKITDETTVDEMANMTIRYGEMEQYPLYMRVAVNRQANAEGDFVNHSVAYSKNVVTSINNMRAEAVLWGNDYKDIGYAQYGSSNGVSGRQNRQVEYLSSDNLLKNDKSNIHAYLEDCIMLAANSTSLSDQDKVALWYLYTTLAQGANTDRMTSVYRNAHDESSELGNTLQGVITTNSNKFYSENVHKALLQRGYLVALHLAYENDVAIKQLCGGKTFVELGNVLSVENNGIKCNDKNAWSDVTNGYCSFIIDRMMAIHCHYTYNGTSYQGPIAFTVANFLRFANTNGITMANYEYEGQAIENYYEKLYATYPGNFIGKTAKIENKYWNLAGFAMYTQAIYPVQGYNQLFITSNNSTSASNYFYTNVRYFGGWGYYPFSVVPEIPIVPDTSAIINAGNKYINMEVTYNAYLGGMSETDDFGTNGHVMTDTVLITKPVNWDVYKNSTIDKSRPFPAKYFKIQLDKSITLDTPFNDTAFNYVDSFYKITNAFGTTSFIAYDEKTNKFVEPTSTTDSIAITPSNIKSNSATSYNYDISGEAIDEAFNRSKTSNEVVNNVEIPSTQLGTGASGWLSKANQYGWYKDSSGSVCLLELFEDSDCTKPVGEGSLALNEVKYDNKVVKPATANSNQSSKPVYKWFEEYIHKSKTYSNGASAYMRFADLSGVVRTFEVKIINGKVAFIKQLKDQNMSIQLRVNYKADVDSAYNNDKFKNVTMNSYMLSKNNIASDFVNDTPHTMIDNHVTDMWGNLTGRDRQFRTSGKDVELTAEDIKNGITKTTKYVPIIQTNNSILFGNGLLTSSGTNLTNNGYAFVQSYSNINQSDTIGTGDVRKIYYLTRLTKYSPIFATGGTGDIWTGKTLKNYANQFGNGVSSQIDISNPILSQTNGVTIRAWDSMTKTNSIKAEQYVAATIPEPNKFLSITYSQSEFNKVLASYNAATYIKRSNLSDDTLKPILASWISTNSSGEYTVGARKVGKIETGTVDNMFMRFGMIRKTSDAKDSGYNYRFVEGTFYGDNSDNKKMINSVTTSLTDTRFRKESSSNVTQGTVAVATPYTQSSYDVKLGYKINGLEVGITLPRNIPSVPTSISTTNGSISRSWQYHLPGNPTSDDGYTDGGKNLFLKVVPEVDMFGESQWTDTQRKLVANGDLPTGQDRPQQTGYYSVTTAGQQYRYVPAMTYSTISFNTSNEVKSQVTGTAVAFDTRAKNLATRLGGADVPVLYSGSGLTIAYNSSAGGTIKAYAIDINGTTVNDANGNLTTIKSEWGNGNYSAKTAAQKSMQGLAEQFNVTTSNKMVIYDSETDTIKDYDLTNPTTGNLSIGNVTNGFVYTLKVRGGYVQTVTAKYNNANVANYDVSVSGNNITVTKGTLANTVTTVEQPSTATIKNMLINMKLVGENNILLQAFDKNTAKYTVTVPNGNDKITESGLLSYLGTVDKYKVNGETRYKADSDWYFEDTSVLVVREYTANLTASTKATDTEQIPINMGPATPKNKNNYFSNGYKGYIVSSVEIRGKDNTEVANRVIVSKSSTHNKVDDSGKVSVWVNGNINASKANAAIAKPDFIISDVTINEATGF